jgi:hypothetical protein
MAPKSAGPAVDDEDPDKSPVADIGEQRPVEQQKRPPGTDPDPAAYGQASSQQTGDNAGSK